MEHYPQIRTSVFQTESFEEGHPGSELGTQKPANARRRTSSTTRVTVGRSGFEKL